MAKKGALGAIDFGAGPDALGELRSWSYDATASEIDTTIMGTLNARKQPGIITHTFEIEVFHEKADAGQLAMYAAIGSETPTLTVLYPNGDTIGEVKYTGNFFVMGIVRQASADGAIEASLTLSSDENGVATATVT